MEYLFPGVYCYTYVHAYVEVLRWPDLDRGGSANAFAVFALLVVDVSAGRNLYIKCVVSTKTRLRLIVDQRHTTPRNCNEDETKL